MNEPFMVKDCALIAIATGMRAQNLRELRDRLRDIDLNCIYYHFWGSLLRPRFDDPEYHNDFAIWVAHSLHNKTLAERLAVIDPAAFDSMASLRDELIEVIEENLDQTEFPKWAERDDQFEFIRSQIVVFDTQMRVEEPSELADILLRMSVGSIFYHFIDARRRRENGLDDFQNWLSVFGGTFEDLRRRIKQIDPYFTPLTRLRRELTGIFRDHFGNR
ncbi:MAG: DUF5752 family protein [Desulfatiglandales bacterium]